VSFLRPLLILACVALPVWVTGRFAPQHEGENPFATLYMHLMPAALEKHPAHGAGAGHDAAGGEPGAGAHVEDGEPPEYLLSLGLPGFLALFDMDVARAGAQLLLTNLQLFQLAAMLLIFVCFSGVPRYLRTGRGDFTSRLFAGFALWIRDEMVLPVMGPELGRRFLPMFLGIFFFVLFMNMLGLVPGAATATASLFVTGALAGITLLAMLICGMVAQGPLRFWLNLVPHVPWLMWPLMFVVEVLGLMIKPFALMIRLFANMSGGHLVVLSLMGMIYVLGGMGQVVGWASAPVSVAFAVFIMIIEFFVAMLQAYIFTMLSILFVQTSIHPQH